MGERSRAVLRGLAANTGLSFDVVGPLVEVDDRETAWALAQRQDITAEAAEALAAHPDVMVRTKLARNPAAARYAWAALVDGPELEVRRDLARGHSGDYRSKFDLPLPEPALWRLAHDEDEFVRASVARRGELSERVALLLAADPDSHVREALAWGRWPEPVRRALLADPEPEVRCAALMLASPPPDLLNALLADSATRQCAARWATPTEALVADDDSEVRRAVAGNPDVPLPLLLRLADDPEESVRAEVMLHRALSRNARARVETTVKPQRYHVAGWLHPGNAPLEERLRYVDSEFVFFRRAIARSSDLPQDAIDRLAAYEDYSVRLLLAENNDTVPGAVVATLIPETGVAKWELARHPALPPEAFASSDDHVLRTLAALSPNLAPATAARLTSDSDRQTRLKAAANPALPLELVLGLLEAKEHGVVTAAASNPAIPADTARELVEQHSNQVA